MKDDEFATALLVVASILLQQINHLANGDALKAQGSL
jgi:hypothetical protein